MLFEIFYEKKFKKKNHLQSIWVNGPIKDSKGCVYKYTREDKHLCFPIMIMH